MKQELIPLKGFRDFLPDVARKRNFALSIIKDTFERFAFEPLETPSLERQSLLLGKYGEEADKLVYKFTDEGGRDIGLRYDQTVPTARVIAGLRDNLGLPFKRYQIQPVWRAEKPQKGRFREFLQCDIDTFGSSSPVCDAEIIVTAVSALKNLGFKNVRMLLNSRLLLFEMMTEANISEDKAFTVIGSIDKLDKLSAEAVKSELKSKGLTQTQIDSLFELIANAQPNTELQEVIEAAKDLGLKDDEYEFAPTLARGLDYYTGVIFELVCSDYKGGSLAGGGRYDNLIGELANVDVKAVGLALGFDRIIEAMDELDLFPKDLASAKVLLTYTDPYLKAPTLNLAAHLRKQNINTFLYPDPEAKLDKQLKLADKKGIPFAIILGEKEAQVDKYTLKDLTKREQELLNLEELLSRLR